MAKCRSVDRPKTPEYLEEKNVFKVFSIRFVAFFQVLGSKFPLSCLRAKNWRGATRLPSPSPIPFCKPPMSRWFLVLAAAALCPSSCSVAGLQTTIPLASFAPTASHPPAISLCRLGACNGMAPPNMYNNLFELMERTQTSQRRRRQTMIKLASSMFSDSLDERGLYGGYLGAKSCRVRMDWEQHLSEVTNREFFALYRFDKRSFYRLLAKVEAVDGSSERPRPVGPPWAPVEAPLRLAMTLRWLAGCRYIGISTMCNLSSGYFYTILWDTIDRISTALAIVSPYEADVVRSEICSGFSLIVPLLNNLFPASAGPGRAWSDGVRRCMKEQDGRSPVGIRTASREGECVQGLRGSSRRHPDPDAVSGPVGSQSGKLLLFSEGLLRDSGQSSPPHPETQNMHP